MVFDKYGRKVEVPFVKEGRCTNRGEYICNLGYACDGCPYNSELLYLCPSCGNEVLLWNTWILPNGEIIYIRRWRCSGCFRIWGIGTKAPIFVWRDEK